LTRVKPACLAVLLALAGASTPAAEAPPSDLAAIGVIVGATPERSVAILQSGGRTRSALVGHSAFGGRVTAVTRGAVRLDFGGRSIELPLSTGTGVAAAPRIADERREPAGPPPGEAMGAVSGDGPRRRTLDRAEVERRITEEMPHLIQAALRPVSEDGRVIGMRVSQIPDGTILQDVGLRSGDVLTDLNGVKVDGLPALMGLWSSLQGASEISATVLRDGAILGLGVSLR
jgi:general secretion pathway protein C